MYVATSLSETKAREFCERAFSENETAVLWVIHLDPKNHCNHVNFVQFTECIGGRVW